MLEVRGANSASPNANEVAETVFWCRILAGFALVIWLLHFVLFGSSASSVNQGWTFFSIAAPASNAAIFMTLAGWLPLNRREGWGALIVTAGLATWLWLVRGQYNEMPNALLLLGLPLGCYLVLRGAFAAMLAKKADKPLPVWVALLFWLAVGLSSMVYLTSTMLNIGQLIYPATWDYHLYRLDAAFGGIAQDVAMLFKESPHWVQRTTVITYALMGMVYFPFLALVYRDKKSRALNIWRVILLPFFIAWICYTWIPAAGPGFIWSDDYPAHVPLVSSVQSAWAFVTFAPRNAMPSMHFSGAILVLMIAAALRKKWLFALSVPFVVITVWATLALGQHYLIDLVVAISFAPALGLLLTNTPKWQRMPSWMHRLMWASFATFGFWMLSIWLVPDWLQSHLHFVQALSLWSAVVGVILLALHLRCVWKERDVLDTVTNESGALQVRAWTKPSFLPIGLSGYGWVLGIFFFSGLAGLVYEVVYAKALGITFGGTALAANTVLMTYMGGMALGGWLGGMLADRSRNPLLLYAVLEAGVGLYAVATPVLFTGIQHLYVHMALDMPPDSAWLTLLRMGLGVLVLSVPTLLMGATLPLMFKHLRNSGAGTDRVIAPLYAANVLGAAAGALVAGYALLPAVGRSSSVMVAAVISLLVALFVFEKLKKAGQLEAVVEPESAPLHADAMVSPDAYSGMMALVVLIIGGAITLALEVVFMHLLAVVAGNSVYAFGLMLAAFLAGLGIGAAVSERLMRRLDRAWVVVLAQCGIAFSILVTSHVWDGLADYMGSFGYVQGIHLGFSAREVIRALVCLLAMLPPAFFIGLSYPAAMGIASDWLAGRRFGRDSARGIGLASALNTVGNIAGVLLTAFWWLPIYGSRNVLWGLAVTAIVLCVAAAMRARTPVQDRWTSLRWLPAAVAAIAMLGFPAQWDFTALSRGGNVYFRPQPWGEVIAHSESVEGGLTTVAKSPQGPLTLLTNGKFQGNNAEGGEMVAQESFALIPLLHTNARKDALVIGYGTGMTARVLKAQGFSRLDVAELSRDMVGMADKYFRNINEGVSSQPGVHMHYTDGRNYLLTQSRKYDLISLEISSIWFAGAANLYNREFYELAKQRLKPGGVLQQWVQLHHMRPIDFLYVMGSLRSEFRYVWVYVSGGQGIIVASNDPSSLNVSSASGLMAGHAISSLKLDDLPRSLVAGPEQVDAFIRDFNPDNDIFVSTDNNMYLEYATPKGNAIDTDTASIIIGMLQGKK